MQMMRSNSNHCTFNERGLNHVTEIDELISNLCQVFSVIILLMQEPLKIACRFASLQKNEQNFSLTATMRKKESNFVCTDDAVGARH